MIQKNKSKNPSSFRDSSGFVYSQNHRVLRQINKSYKIHYDALINSGLYDSLLNQNLLIQHQEVSKKRNENNCYKIIKPQPIPFISYPYEWCFEQLKQAALLTLKIQKLALDHGMILKDASAYNIQFIGTIPILIDTLSFEIYKESEPWIAYRQFCQHFLAPLSLMSSVDLRLNSLLISHLDGIPLDLASRLLPKSTSLNFGLLSHIHFQAKTQTALAKKALGTKKVNMGKRQLYMLIDNLFTTVDKLKLNQKQTTWSEYYQQTNYTNKAFNQKKRIVEKYLSKTRSKMVLDLGANTGVFSQIATDLGLYTLSVDNDPMAIEKNFQKFQGSETILPLIIDITNPSPSIGWNNQERMSFLDRCQADTVLALALIHHLAIANNLPLDRIAEVMAFLGNNLIIEFVPKSDSQTQILLAQREDIFPDYEKEHFEKAFSKYFKLVDQKPIKESDRTLYIMRKR